MKISRKLFSGAMFKNLEEGPFHNSRNIFPYIFETKKTDKKKILMGVGLVFCAGVVVFGGMQYFLVQHDEQYTLEPEYMQTSKAKELAMGWWQDRYWKSGDPIYLPKAKDSDYINDNSPSDWPIEKALSYLDEDEWWENFESTRPRNYLNILPSVFNVFKIQKNSMEGATDEEDEEGDEEEKSGESLFALPYNFYNPSSQLPSDRADYRRVMEVVHSGLPRKSAEVPELYRNDLAGCTAIIDPDGPRPIKVTFSNDWRDLSPELLTIIRERLIWKYQDDWTNYAPPQISQQLKNKWNEYLNVEITQN